MTRSTAPPAAATSASAAAAAAAAASSGPAHRVDVDGLRGLAVVLVVLFHAWPAALTGGFVGVDVFFVVSGYVVSRMVQRQLAAGSFRLHTFVLRRVNRLAPALLLVVTTTLGLGMVLLSPTLMGLLAGHGAAGLLMVANLILAAQASYFDVLATSKPLLHLWSLSVEEQFYVGVPIAAALARRAPRVARAALPLATVASLATCLALTASHPTLAFYLPVSRAWELLCGVIVGVGLTRGPRTARGAQAAAWTGLVLIVATAVGIDESSAFPGPWALPVVLGTALMLWSGPGTSLGRLFSRPGAVTLGLISYPLYLWHWPLLVLARLMTPTDLHALVTVLMVGLAALLSYATWRFLEQPVRQAQRRWTAFAAVLGAVGLSAWCLRLVETPASWAQGGYAAALVSRFEREYDHGTDARLGSCWRLEYAAARDPESCVEREPAASPLVYVWGDSHAARFTAGLREVQAERHDFRLGQRARLDCPPLLDFGTRFCREANVLALDELQRHRPDVLVLHARWWKYDDLGRVARTLAQLGRELPTTRIVVVGPTPVWRVSLSWAIARHGDGDVVPERLTPEGFTRQRAVDERFRAVAAAAGVTYVSALDVLCGASLRGGDGSSGGCLVALTQEPLMLSAWDHDHLTTPAARLVARRLVESW